MRLLQHFGGVARIGNLICADLKERRSCHACHTFLGGHKLSDLRSLSGMPKMRRLPH